MTRLTFTFDLLSKHYNKKKNKEERNVRNKIKQKNGTQEPGNLWIVAEKQCI